LPYKKAIDKFQIRPSFCPSDIICSLMLLHK
jgi:hypothetical protein